MTEFVGNRGSPGRSPIRTAPPQLFERYRERLQEALRRAVPQGTPGIHSLLRYHLGWEDQNGSALSDGAHQGKALRPTLCLFACEALDGDWRNALPAAAALELAHNFSLIHDDIQDGDRERRHRPTVWSLWGRPNALWAGNAMRILADLAAASPRSEPGASPSPYGAPAEAVARASQLLTQRYVEMIEGQYLDLSYEGRLDIAVEDYIYMVSHKTGALIRCAMELGAIMAGADDIAIETFGGCGHLLGLAFQIKDDVLGIWGDTAATGKAAGNDIWRRKKSFPVVYTFQHASGADREALIRIYRTVTLQAEDVEQVLTIMEAVGARQYSEAQAGEHASLSLKSVQGLQLNAWAKDCLEEMVQFLVARDY
ncbi:MAG: polyprenyl synthetase family protein [Chloroflexota bacterium]|nr:polyprenyl synthetase family protein [Chloroflexota bacterium]